VAACETMQDIRVNARVNVAKLVARIVRFIVLSPG